MKRPTQLAIVIAAVVLAAGGGWIAGSRVKSPAQIAAETEPPAPSKITVPIELRTLTSEIIVRGDITFEEPETITLLDPPGGAEGVSIVTLAPSVGEELSEGDRAMEISGRPILVLSGDLPMFRSLRLGDSGDDVLQLEEALTRLGFELGAPDRVYDTETASAVEAWYRSLGYSPKGANEQEQAELDAARQAVDDATAMVRDAELELAMSKQPLPASQRMELDEAVRRAEHDLEEAKTQAESANALAEQAVVEALSERDHAAAASDLADSRLAEAESGTHPDTGLSPTEDELAQLRDEASQATTALSDAESSLLAAQDNQEQTAGQGDWSISEAEHQLAVAKASRSEALAGPDTSVQRRMVSDARARLSEAEADLAELQAQAGVTAPRSEILFIRSLPVRVQQVFAERGDTVAGRVLEVTGQRLAIASSVDVRSAEHVGVGTEVLIELPTWPATETEGVVSLLAERPGTNGLDAGLVYMEITALDDLSEYGGANVKIEIPLETTGGDVLSVPVSALSAATDGTARIEVEWPDGATEMCSVEAGLTSGGYVEITPLDADLSVGDRVVVGRDYGGT